MSQVTTHTKNHVTYTSCPHVTIGLPKKKKIPAVATLAGYSRPCAASSQSQGCICRPIIEVCFSTSASRPLACSETKAYSRSTTCCVSPSASGGLLQTKGRSVVVLFLPTRRLGKPSNPPMTSTERNSLIETLKASNDLDSCLAVCAVSGSMVNILDGVLFQNLSLFTLLSHCALFSHRLRNHVGPTHSLPSRKAHLSKEFTQRRVWLRRPCVCAVLIEPNTDFNAVFTKLLLFLAVEAKLPNEEMIRRLFVFSDVQFVIQSEGVG